MISPGPIRTVGRTGSASAQRGYEAGACNIGTEEIARRRAAAVGAAAVAVLLWAILVTLGAPHLARLLVVIPASAAAISALQVRNRFCVNYATRGLYNTDGPAGRTQRVSDAVARRVDRARAYRMIATGVTVGLLVGLLAVLVP
jgi:hypothetical protein